MYSQIEFSLTGRSIVQSSRNFCGVSECDHEASIRRRPRSTKEDCTTNIYVCVYIYIYVCVCVYIYIYNILETKKAFSLPSKPGKRRDLVRLLDAVYEHSVDCPFLSFISFCCISNNGYTLLTLKFILK